MSLTSCGSGRRAAMLAVLDEADSLNRNYIPLTNDSALQDAVAYFDSHGTANERMRARYLLGCVYRDKGEAPDALSWFQEAIEHADTTDAICNFALLSRVQGQMASIFIHQSMYQEAIRMIYQCYESALNASDTAMALSAYNNLPTCYQNLGENDSALIICERASNLYRQYGDTISANTALGPACYLYLEKENYAKAKECLDLYEFHSDIAGLDTFLNTDYYVFYYHKGLYLLATGHQDSALYYFRKQLSVQDDLNVKTLAYKGLYTLYKKQGIRDSIVKYADLYHESYDLLEKSLVYENLENMQSLYNYNVHKQQAEKAKQRMQEFRIRFIVAGCLLVLSSFIIIWWCYMHKRQMRELSGRYVLNFLAYQNLTTELRQLKSQSTLDNARQEKLENEIKLLKYVIAQSQTDGKEPDEWNVADDLLHSSIVALLHSKAQRGEQATNEDILMLRRDVNQYEPLFMSKLSTFEYQPDLRETLICILVRLRFAPFELGALLGLGSSNVSKIRKTLLQKMFFKNGPANQFDDEIRMLEL
ncbi:MAG: hypothetical protein IJ081_00210 [Prevotella sp.]|nr:hypothetical protein [Prevotella sp.]